ncbi:hypothetical protein [Anaerosporobacter sp.]|uniref:hypothetical protein n=1 Tax=Anaerosporobacter sp. TaxID=1872529 RepID=UPI00286F1927|nr:hypothetical protein [Anaerosporobacter sp.]
MKILKKSILSLMLVMTLLFSNTPAKAASHYIPLGGTWYITDMVSNDPLSFGKIPMQVTYVPNNIIRALHNADLSTSNCKDYLKSFGSQAVTTYIASLVKTKYNLDLAAFVGTAFVISDIISAIDSDSRNAAINSAYKANSGLKITIYQANGFTITETSNWYGNYIDDTLPIIGINGYAKGRIVSGDYDLL